MVTRGGMRWLTIFCLLAAAACSQPGGGGTRPVATVDGRDIGLEDFKAQAAFMGLGGDPHLLTPELRRQVVDTLVDQWLVMARARELGISLEPEELEAAEDRLRRGLGDSDFERALTVHGIGYAQWRTALARRLLVQKTLELVLAPKIRISAREVRRYFQAHRDQFRRPEQVLAQHAVLPTRELARRLLQKVAGGQDMGRAAAELGAPLVDGGEPVWLSRGHMPPALEDKIFALKPGSLAGPLASDYGYHVVKLLAKRPASPGELATAAARIQRRLAAAKMEDLAEQWLNRLRRQAKVEYNQSFLKHGRLQPPGR